MGRHLRDAAQRQYGDHDRLQAYQAKQDLHSSRWASQPYATGDFSNKSTDWLGCYPRTAKVALPSRPAVAPNVQVIIKPPTKPFGAFFCSARTLALKLRAFARLY